MPWGHPCLLSLTFLPTKSPSDVPCKGFGHAPIWAWLGWVWLGGREVPRQTQSRGLTQAPEGVLHCLKGGPGQLPAGGGEQVGSCQQAAPWQDRWRKKGTDKGGEGPRAVLTKPPTTHTHTPAASDHPDTGGWKLPCVLVCLGRIQRVSLFKCHSQIPTPILQMRKLGLRNACSRSHVRI